MTSLVEGADAVPRLSLASVASMRENLARLHFEDGLMQKIEARRKHSGGSAPSDGGNGGGEGGGEVEAQWAGSVLGWLRQEAAASQEHNMLYPPGRILWRPQRSGDAVGSEGIAVGKATVASSGPSASDSASDSAANSSANSAAEWMEADPSTFDTILLCGSQMLTSHFPRSYLDAIGRDAT